MSALRHNGDSSRHAAMGTLWASDGVGVPVSITQRADDILLIVLDRALEFISGPLDYLMLESTGGRGVLRTPGTGEVLEPNLLRFRTIIAEQEVVQRREFVRLTVAQRVRLDDAEGEKLLETLTTDLSGGGMRIVAPPAFDLPPETPVHFTMFLGGTEDGTQIEGNAEVVRRTGEDHIAFRFTEITHRSQERLIRFLFDRQRAALRITRGDTI